ncbi:hypothetical protein [Sphingomonas radiodurans]|uniref:hypothetical protein n=1 Tax=Sphingomonas radiodurans TaxID=2890321 RepID=UPI001E3D24DF|nr:hypothetical protein [Sphingomonas radiodurans]WBH15112.1 hypothetical protein LLW23_09560 [Sphingomonas radiodurans]
MNSVRIISPERALAYVAIVLAVVLAALAVPKEMIITRWYFLHQDALAGIVMAGLLLLAIRRKLPRTDWIAAPRTARVLLASLLLALLLWVGTYTLMADYALTRDELMVEFDRAIFAAGTMSLPLPAAWAGYAVALVPAFLLDVPANALLVSAYMPVNAAMRAAFGLVLDPALMNPLLAAAGLLLLHRIARRLFPDCVGAQWVALAGYMLSAQVLVTAMTPYAMTAHLVFDLAWLALFLRDRWWSHVLAMAIGVAAIGLHQVVFHPLFAGPFILLLLAERRWRLFGIYALVYAAALLFWISWPQIVVAAGGVPAGGSTAGGGSFLIDRVLPLLRDRDPRTIALMLHNMLRAVTWNAAFVLPFVILAVPAIRRREGMALPLAAGVVLTLVAMAVLLPFQGHGWGYRYVHGLLGNAMLLAGYGYRELARRDAPRAAGLALLLGLGTLPIVAWLLATSHGFVAPYARLTHVIERQRSDFVIVDTEPPSSAIDQVRNRPDLGNRPLIFSSKDLSQAQIADLCARGSITLITRRDFHGVGFAPDLPEQSRLFARRTAMLARRACLRRPIG